MTFIFVSSLYSDFFCANAARSAAISPLIAFTLALAASCCEAPISRTAAAIFTRALYAPAPKDAKLADDLSTPCVT